MGLDISVISQIEKVEIPEDIELWSDEYYDWEETLHGSVWNLHPQYPFHEQGEGIEEGAYISTGEDWGFRAGSYGGYGMWREWLAQASGHHSAESMWDKADEGDYGHPFMELINFSDADGVIGPVASKKLYRDFVTNESNVMNTMDHWYLTQKPIRHDSWRDGEEPKPIDRGDFQWFQARYKDWTEAFRIASDNGAVIFH